MQAAGGHAYERRHCAVDSVAEAEPLGIKIVEALANKCRVDRKDGGGFADDAVAFLEAADAIARFRNDASEFVAED